MQSAIPDAEHRTPTMNIADNLTGATFAHVVPEKGNLGGWISNKIAQDIDFMGYGNMRVKGVKNARAAPTTLINSPVGESQANGFIERRIQTAQAQARTLKSSLESQAKCKISSDHLLISWMIEWSASIINRFVFIK